ncbi:glutaminase [Corynebacterium tapiri]|uniref:Glutaminase n=1 Tax=Corynebacterium tapiri TaxID=1448266 RepID=A0A5C4U2R4_9CORY|nr:glutaminase [Corynebacterium tapiri]TNL95654.1 glutaminase [Corynebacterium tapiri]
MNSLITDYLAEVLDEVRDDTAGEVPTYIPALQKADPNWLGVALCTVSGNVYSTGDSSPEFTIQSVSKPFAYALALQEFGIDKVREHVGMEPSGEAFNELSLEEEDKRPLNAMINVGAITINQLLNGTDSTVEDRVEYIRKYFSELAGRDLRIDEDAVEGELEGADRNLSIAHMLRSYGIIHDEAHDAVLSYTQQCSILVTIEDLAVMSATLANGGVNPKTGKKILDADVCRHTMAVMASCGMYDAAGRWLAKVGIPAKSGVSGGLIGALPGQLGIASLSPRLDEVGNSVRGVTVFEHLSDDMGMHLMNTENRAGSHAVRSITREGDCTTVHIQGIVNFVAAEAIVQVLNQHDFTTGRVLLDVSRIVESHPIARRMLKEGLRRLREDGHEIGVIDPEGELRSRVLDDGSRLPLVE